jgi:hypothetical protein
MADPEVPINAKSFAEYYLSRVLGDRAGLNFREVVPDAGIQSEIVDELASMIRARDRLLSPEIKSGVARGLPLCR